MTAKRPGLGKSLSALLQVSEEEANTSEAPFTSMLPLSQLKPGQYQPRTVMDQEALEALADSIKNQGLLQPIVVRKCDSQFEIIAGERRYQASKLAGLDKIPAIIRDINDETAMAVALIENLQREALNAIDEAHAIERLTFEFNLTHQEIADLLSKSRTSVSNSLRLLKLSAGVKKMVEEGFLEMGHARALLNLDEAEQVLLARRIVDEGLSVRRAEALAKNLKNALKVPVPGAKDTALILNQVMGGDLDRTLSSLSSKLGAKVQIKSSASGKGRIWVDFKSATEFKHLMAALSGEEEELEALM